MKIRLTDRVCILNFKNAEEAIRNVLINGAFIEEQEYLEEFCKTVLPAFKLNFKL